MDDIHKIFYELLRIYTINIFHDLTVKNYYSIKVIINTFICRKKSQLMTPPWSFSSLSARLFFMSVSLRVRLDSSLSKIFLKFKKIKLATNSYTHNVGNMEKNLLFRMTPHLLSITFRITSNYCS